MTKQKKKHKKKNYRKETVSIETKVSITAAILNLVAVVLTMIKTTVELFA